MNMFPVDVIRDRLANLLAADATTLAPAEDGVKVTLITGDIELSPALTILDFADRGVLSNGLAAINAAPGTQNESVDPVTTNRKVELKEPAGGWRWETTSKPDPSITVTGAIVTNNDFDALYGIIVFDDPITLNDTNQSISIGTIELPISQTAFEI